MAEGFYLEGLQDTEQRPRGWIGQGEKGRGPWGGRRPATGGGQEAEMATDGV